MLRSAANSHSMRVGKTRKKLMQDSNIFLWAIDRSCWHAVKLLYWCGFTAGLGSRKVVSRAQDEPERPA